jgi:hypothetical protein
MTAVNYTELALIELEHIAADHSARQLWTSDPLELADLSLRLRTILTAITALRLAMDVTRVAFDCEATDRLVSLASEPSARRAARPALFDIKTARRRH